MALIHCQQTLVSSEARRARELNPNGCKATRPSGKRRPVPTGNTLLSAVCHRRLYGRPIGVGAIIATIFVASSNLELMSKRKCTGEAVSLTPAVVGKNS